MGFQYRPRRVKHTEEETYLSAYIIDLFSRNELLDHDLLHPLENLDSSSRSNTGIITNLAVYPLLNANSPHLPSTRTSSNGSGMHNEFREMAARYRDKKIAMLRGFVVEN